MLQNASGTAEQQAQHIVFLLLPGFTLTAVTGAIDTLRLANKELQRPHYTWSLAAENAGPVQASCGLTLGPVDSWREIKRADLLMVCGGEHVTEVATPGVIDMIRRVAIRSIALGAMCTGSYPLARAGLLDGYRASIHWQTLPAVVEQCPQVYFGEQVFVIDRDRLTCAGGTGSLDLMLAMLGKEHGHELAARISEQLIVAQLRSDHDHQLVPLYAHLGRFHTKLVEAATIMHANIDDPLSVDEVAVQAGISRRQLERLFKRHVGQVPTRYYQQMRLRRARQLLLQSGLPITEIAAACGFRSPPHFSKAYRAYFGQAPSAERRPAIRPAHSPEQPAWLDEPDPMLVSEDLATALASPDVAATDVEPGVGEENWSPPADTSG